MLAADSRVTLTATDQQRKLILPATFDNATKLLKVNGQTHVGAVTYGAGSIGTDQPRTAHSYLPEFERELRAHGDRRYTVKTFARKLGEFFLQQWKSNMPATYSGPEMIFLVGGYDRGKPYGSVFEISIPSRPQPKPQIEDTFGFIWGGQRQFVDRLIQGFDPKVPAVIKDHLGLDDKTTLKLQKHLQQQLGTRIPYQFLPLQDCVDLAIFLDPDDHATSELVGGR